MTQARSRQRLVATALAGGAIGIIALVGGPAQAVLGQDPTTTTTDATTTTEATTTTAPTQFEDGMEITNVICEVTIQATVSTAGDHEIRVWDDGEIIATLPFTAAAPGTTEVHYTVIAQPGESAPGLGFYLHDAQDSLLYYVDPYLVDACVPVETTEPTETTETESTETTASANGPSTPSATAAESIAGSANYTG